MERKTKMTIFVLFSLLLVAGPAGIVNTDLLWEGQVLWAAERHMTREVEIYRNDGRHESNRLKMIDLCNRLEDDWNRAEANRKTEVEVYRDYSEPGVTEYRREMRESGRFAYPADELKTLELCRQLETSRGAPRESEVRIYRESTVPGRGEVSGDRRGYPGDQY